MSDSPILNLRGATAADVRQVWEWRNEETARRASFNSDPIAFDTHETWFPRQLARSDCRMFIIEADGHACGVVRIDRIDTDPEISIALGPACRGHGYGPRALKQACDRLFRETPAPRVSALVREDNPASASAFVRAGFVAEGSFDVSGVPAHRFVLERPAVA